MKTVKVRIAVGVDRDGGWNAVGWEGASDQDMKSTAIDTIGAGEQVYFLTAELPVPEDEEWDVEVSKD